MKTSPLKYLILLPFVVTHGKISAQIATPTPSGAQIPRPADTAKWEPPNRRLPLPEAIVDITLEPAKVNLRPGREYSDTAREVDMTPSIVRTTGGRLWSSWISGGDEDTGYVVAATSDDDGKSWSPVRLVIDEFDPPGARQRSITTNVWLDPKGRLWLFYDQSLDYFDGRGGVWATVCENPDAPAPEWSIPRRIWHGAMLNKPTVLASGEWLLSVSLWPGCIPEGSRLFGAHKDLDPFRGVNIISSKDSGKTWTRLGGIFVEKSGFSWDFDEPMIIERKDHSLWMPLRTRGGIVETTSADGGVTWSTPVKSSFDSTNSRFFLRRLASGRIVLVKNGRKVDEFTGMYQRSDMTAFVSDDEGQTWKGGLVLDERGGTSYPDGCQGPDGRIYVTHDWNRYAVPPLNSAKILLSVFTEDDVLAGKLVSPGSRLKEVINEVQPVRK